MAAVPGVPLAAAAAQPARPAQPAAEPAQPAAAAEPAAEPAGPPPPPPSPPLARAAAALDALAAAADLVRHGWRVRDGGERVEQVRVRAGGRDEDRVLDGGGEPAHDECGGGLHRARVLLHHRRRRERDVRVLMERYGDARFEGKGWRGGDGREG